MFNKFKLWFRKKIYCNHDYQLYIFYDKNNFIYKCEKCDKQVYIDQEENVRFDEESDIELARQAWRELTKVADDSIFILRTRKYRMITEDPVTWKKYIEKLKKEK